MLDRVFNVYTQLHVIIGYWFLISVWELKLNWAVCCTCKGGRVVIGRLLARGKILSSYW